MKRYLLAMLIMASLSLGAAANASAVEISIVDGKSLSYFFEKNILIGHKLTGQEMSYYFDSEFELVFFSAYSAGKSDVSYNGEVIISTNNTRNGYIGTEIGVVTLGDLSISTAGKNILFSDVSKYANGAALQAYVLDEDMTINSVFYGAGSIFIGYEDGSDKDYNDIVLALRKPAATPIPAAGWLLGSGLAGLVAIRRKSNKS